MRNDPPSDTEAAEKPEGAPDAEAEASTESDIEILSADAEIPPELEIPDAPLPEEEDTDAEVRDLKDRLLRAAAETENLRRRTEREKTDLRKYAVTGFARDMLVLADNLSRALAAMPTDRRQDDKELDNLMSGLELTEKELLKTFEKYKISMVEAAGKRLDPNLHQAMMQVEDTSVPAGTIVQVIQEGYVIEDRLLRPALVGVSTGGPKPEKSEPTADAAKESE